MRFAVDIDLAVFLYATGKLLFTALPTLRKSTPHIPALYQIENVPEASLTKAQANYFAPYDEKLAAMNYRPVCSYLISNYGKNLTRHYLNPAENSRCEVVIHELTLTVEGKKAFTSSCVIHFHTRFTDDRVLTTRNMKLKNILDNPPYWVLQECPQIDDPAKLKRIHDARAQTMGRSVAPPTDVDRILKDVQSEHERYSAYQLSVGGYLPVPGEDSYALSDKVNWRGIRNYFNPLAQGISARIFFPVAILAAALPVFARLEYAPAAAHALRILGLPPALAVDAIIRLCYFVAGALIGYFFERETFLWGCLLTYLPVRLFVRGDLGPIPYSALAAGVAYCVAQIKKRRRAVLIPQPAPVIRKQVTAPQ
jgi:hypothetical protein